MHSAKLDEDKRESVRRHLYHTVNMRIGADTLLRECIILDISDEGVRLYVVGFNVPDEFVVLLSGDDGIDQENKYKVIWRLGREVGAKSLLSVGPGFPSRADTP
jgi:hypothetical protein